MPDSRLEHLVEVARQWGTGATALIESSDRFRTERLVQEAGDLQRRHRPAAVERDTWVDHGPVDGIPEAVLAGSGTRSGSYRHRFEAVPDSEGAGQDVQLADGLVLLLGSEDSTSCWLRAGEGLSAMWLAATTGGLSVVPLSQVVEVAATRDRLRREVLRGFGHPLLLTRVGWQAIGRSDLVRTPRRPLADVLDT